MKNRGTKPRRHRGQAPFAVLRKVSQSPRLEDVSADGVGTLTPPGPRGYALGMDVDASFADWFGTAPDVRTSAPGRVNLMGEHTDYNGGFVLPLALPLQTYVLMARRSDRRVRVGSFPMDPQRRDFDTDDLAPRGDWVDCVRGALGVLQERSIDLKGVDIAVSSEVPIGAGLSSSAALCVALLRGFSEIYKHHLSPVDIALLAQSIEHRWVGANVGVMDQMASSCGRCDAALYLDTLTLQFALCRIPSGIEFLVVDSGVRHSHAHGDYNMRRKECEAACQTLGVGSLRDLEWASDQGRVEALPDVLRRRATHVLLENERVHAAVKAMEAGDVTTLARLFAESHASERDLYEVSVPQVDALRDCLDAEADILGTRMTGGGFGGSVVSVARAGTGAAAARRAIVAAGAQGIAARLLNVPSAVN
jgi:galactokinase